MRRKRTLWIIVPLAAVAVLALFAAVGLLSNSGGSSSSSSASTSMRSADLAQTAPESVQGADYGTASKASSGASAAGQDVAAAVPPASSPSSHYLLRTGDLSLLVARGTLLSTVDRITSMTTGMGGYVTSSAVGSQQTTVTGAPEPMPLDDTSGGGASVQSEVLATSDPYATLTVRVPERSFDEAVKRFAKLGAVQSVSTSSEDVTSQYVDLQARLRHFRAVERRLVGFLADTANVSQMLAVQDRIDRVQLTIEELTAQLKSLSETTTYGTMSIYVREKGAAHPGATHTSGTFGGTFWNSVKLLGRGARVTGLVLTAMLPFVVAFGAIALAVWYGVRRLRRGHRQPAQPTLPA